MDGCCKAFCHVLLFVVLQPVVRKSSPFYRYTSTMSLPRKKGIAKKIIQTVRALMISQNIDLVAGDFNGAAWHWRSRDNISTIDEVFSDCALLTPQGPHHCGDSDPSRTIGLTSVVFLSPLAPSDSGK